MPPSSNIAMLIKDMRQQAHLTQEMLGNRIGVTKAAISSYEKGKTNPSDSTLEKLAKEFDLSIDTLREEIAGDSVVKSLITLKRVQKAARVNTYPLLPLSARATFAESFAQDYNFSNLKEIEVMDRDGDPKRGLIVDINGDSMDPQLRSGMQVLVEEVPPVDGWKLARPGVYMIVYRNHMVIKRIKENTLSQSGDFWLYSDNPDGGRELVRIDDLRGMWRVVRIVHGAVH